MFSLLTLKPKTSARMTMKDMCSFVVEELQDHGFIGSYVTFDSTSDRGVIVGQLIPIHSDYEIEIDLLGKEVRLVFHIIGQEESFVEFFSSSATDPAIVEVMKRLRQYIEDSC